MAGEGSRTRSQGEGGEVGIILRVPVTSSLRGRGWEGRAFGNFMSYRRVFLMAHGLHISFFPIILSQFDGRIAIYNDLPSSYFDGNKFSIIELIYNFLINS